MTANCGTPFAATANSGKSCTASATVCVAGEVCQGGFKNAAGTAVKMCLGKCCANEATPTDPVNKCMTPGVSNGAAPCALITGTTMACGWICDIQGNKFDCPDATNYDCVVVFASQPDIKFCVPKP